MADTPEDRLRLANAEARLSQPSLHLKLLARDLHDLAARHRLSGPEAYPALRTIAERIERASVGLERLEARLDRLEGRR